MYILEGRDQSTKHLTLLIIGAHKYFAFYLSAFTKEGLFDDLGMVELS